MLRDGQDTPRPLRQQVFEYVRAQGNAARADITHALGISAGSTTTLTADLIAGGYLREFERQPRGTGRGRPKVALEIVPEAAHVVGIKLAFGRHTAVLSDFAGNVIADAAVTSPERRRPVVRLLGETEALLNKLLEKCGKSRQDIGAVGIGMPGIIDHATGTVVWSSMLETREEALSAAFSDRFGIPVSLDNDANMLTLAELWFGEGRAISDFAVVTVESGVGMGLVLGNQLYRGAHGMGLELGHTKVQLDGALCQCGQRGCLEAYLADYALTREASTALGHSFDRSETPEQILATLFEKAKSGHPAADTIFRRAGRFLSLGLSNVVQLFDPALIILSGERMQYAQFYADEVFDAMRKMTLNEGRRPCRVVINAWDDLVWARGASALALSTMTANLIGGEARAA
ncbi:ROK family protein [Marimonas sp. MJW-29]|uniref:ROK family protein n=1 Tax=Sulfitobacter sediminis TaxID=3234186 RepID=A0ABV3RSY5_9RHOB